MFPVMFSCRLSAQQCLDHFWLRESGCSLDIVPSYLSFHEQPSAYSSNSTIVPDEEYQSDMETLSQAPLSSIDSSSSSSSSVDVDPEAATTCAEATETSATSATAVVSVASGADSASASSSCSAKAVNEDTFLTSLPINRRAGSLPFRWRVPPRRDASGDRVSDLGYGSDGISEMSSTDSSSDRSSIISLDDSPLELAQTAMRRYSDTSLAAERLWRRTWERFLPATAGTCSGLPCHLFRQDGSLASSVRAGQESGPGSRGKPWEKICNGSLARAMDKFNPLALAASSSASSSSSSDLSQSTQCLHVASALTPRAASVTPVRVSEVRTRLLSGPANRSCQGGGGTRTPLVHLDKAEIVKSRLVKFRTPPASSS